MISKFQAIRQIRREQSEARRFKKATRHLRPSLLVDIGVYGPDDWTSIR